MLHLDKWTATGSGETATDHENNTKEVGKRKIRWAGNSATAG